MTEFSSKAADRIAAATQIVERQQQNKRGRSGQYDSQPDQVRLAKTAADPVSSSYPAEGTACDTYWFIFQDGEFPDTVGDQTPTYTARPTTAKFKAHNIESTEWLAKGTPIQVSQHNGQWWFERAPEAETVQWGKATQASADADGSHTCPWVRVNPCDDCVGTNPVGGTTIDVRLPKRAGFRHGVALYDVIAYSESESGVYTCDSDYTDTRIRFGVAQSDWADNSGDPKVSVKACDRDGTNVVGAAFDVFLSVSSSEDPAVFTDDVIGYFIDKDDDEVAVGYGDDPIGTIKLWSLASGSIREGWVVCDDAGGGVTDMENLVAVGAGDEYSLNDTGGYKWHGLTENNHTDHDYGLCTLTEGELATGIEWFWSYINASTPDAFHDGPSNSGDDTDNRQPYRALFFIQRVK